MSSKPRRWTAWKVAVPAVITVSIVAIGVAAYASTGSSELDAVRTATSQFRRVDAAAPNYQRFVDVNGIACIDMPGLGGMGVHYVNQALVGDGAIDASTPEALVYQPDGQGQPRLVAVEYLVVKAQWDESHTEPPSLFGQPFNVTTSPNRFGLPDFYSLHAWVWKHNPAGTFAMWNPNVSCNAANNSHGSSGYMGDMAH